MHLTQKMLSYGPLSNEIFCGSFLIKNLVIFVRATTVKQILFLNHVNSKVVEGKHNALVSYVDVCAPEPAGVVLWNPFK